METVIRPRSTSISAIKFVNLVVPSPGETEPYNKLRYQLPDLILDTVAEVPNGTFFGML